MTPRRLAVLIRGLPAEALVWAAVEAEHQKSLKPTAEQIRARQEYHRQREAAT